MASWDSDLDMALPFSGLEHIPYNEPFPFMDLPAELRNKVYTYLLVLPDAIGIFRDREWSNHSKKLTYDSPFLYNILRSKIRSGRCGENYKTKLLTIGLLYICRKIHHEASFLLYSKNIFRWFIYQKLDEMKDDWGVMNTFMENIGRTNASHFKQISICYPELALRWGTDATGNTVMFAKLAS